jgi:hypothetical protein
MAGFKVMIMSFIERAMSLAKQFDPLWVLPAWLRTMIMSAVQFFLAVASLNPFPSRYRPMDAQGQNLGFNKLLVQTGHRSGQADGDSSILSSRRSSKTQTQIAPAGPHRLITIPESCGDVPPARGTPERVRSSPDANSEARAPRRGSHSYIIVGGPVKHLTSHRAWPAQREARGLLTVKASPTHSKGLCAECSVQNDVLTLSIARASRESSGASIGTVVAVPVEELAVGLQRGRTDMFIIATRNGDKLFDDISCFADDQEKRNKWIAVLRRMGVPIFDLSSSDGRKTVGRPIVF